MRRILLLVISVCIGVGLLLTGCRKSETTSRDKQQNETPGSLDSMNTAEVAGRMQVRGDEEDAQDGEEVRADMAGEQVETAIAPESQPEIPEVELAGETVTVSPEAGLAEVGGVALPQPESRPEEELADVENNANGTTAEAPELVEDESARTADKWLQERSKALLEKEKALIAHASAQERDEAGAEPQDISEPDETGAKPVQADETAERERTLWSRPALTSADGSATDNNTDSIHAGVRAMAPAKAKPFNAPPEEPELDMPEIDVPDSAPALLVKRNNANPAPIADDKDVVAPDQHASQDEVVPLLTVEETEDTRAPVTDDASTSPVAPPLPPEGASDKDMLVALPAVEKERDLPGLPEMSPEIPGVVEPAIEKNRVIAADGDEAPKAADDGDDPQPTPAPEVDPRTRKAQELAAKEARASRLKAESLRAESNAKFRAGMNFFKNALYEDALSAFEEALLKNPDNQQALDYRNRCIQLLGRPARDNTDILIRELSDREKTQRDAVVMQTKADLEKAAKLLLRAISPDEAQMLKPRDQQIQEALGNLAIAREKLRKVESILTSSPMSTVSQKEMRLQVQALKVQVREATRKLMDEQEVIERKEAMASARRRRLSTQSIRRERLARLLQSAAFHFQKEEYEKAADLASEILKMDPRNGNAMEMRTKALSAAHQKMQITNARRMHDAEVNWTLDVRDQAIMPSSELVYPEDWERIKRRVSRKRAIEGGSLMEKQIRDRLAGTRVTVDYNETPINDVLRELQEKGGINIVANTDVDPETTVSITVTNMSLGKVLDWIMRLKELHYEIRNEAIYVTREPHRRLMLQLYPVFDLTRPMQNYFPTSAGDDDDDDDDDDEGGAAVTDIKDRITKFVDPDSWEGEGVTLEIWEDNLLVMQTPEVHAKLVAYLKSLREAAKQQVLVEGRFINITKNFLEELGVTWDATQERGGLPSAPLVRDGHGVFWDKQNDGRRVTINGSLRSGGALPPNQTAGQGLNAIIAHLMMDPGTGGIGSLRQFEINAVLHALQEKKQGSVLHNPRLLVANGRNAYLQIYTTTNYVSNWTQQGTVFQPVVQSYEQGVEWSVRPVISFDRKYITIRVRPTLTAYDSVNSQQRIDNRAVIAINPPTSPPVWEVQELPYLLPVIETTQLESFVTIPDGGTVLMGGLIHDKRDNNISGIPLVSSIPFAGRLFRTERHDNQQRNIVIMVQGKIIELED